MNTRQKRGLFLVFLGLSLVFLSLWMHNTQEKQDAMAGEHAQVLLSQLQKPSVQMSLPQQTPYAMAEKEYQGYTMIGTLRIRSLQLELPILSTWNETWLQAAPCRYSGSVYSGDLILMGHNYRSHFSPLHHIAAGSEVEFEDVNGIVYHYLVDKTEILQESDVEKLTSEYPLSLFTCTAGGKNRIVIRCTNA